MRQLIIAIIIALTTVIFALQNATPITISLFFWSIPDTSLALVLIVTLATGLLAGMLFALPSSFRKSRSISELKRKIAELENGPNQPEPARDPSSPSSMNQK
jgi:lipopolysaccharide assembly protein A